jgi:hypothetical protein
LYIWPRFKLDVSNVLNSKNQPEVIEYSQPMSVNMQYIQSAILVAMKNCMDEIKRQAPFLEIEAKDNSNLSLTLENALFKSFDMSIRTRLEADWHHVNYKTKQLASDLSQLRKLLDYLLCYDAYSFYSFLLSVKSSSVSVQQVPALWLTSDAAQHIFEKSKNRLFQISPVSSSHMKEVGTSRPEIVQELSSITHTLLPVKDVPPKWQLFLQIIDEIKRDFSGGAAGEGTYRTLVLVKDTRTAIQLRDILRDGIANVLDQRHRWLISQLCSDIKAKAKYGYKPPQPPPSTSFGSSNPALKYMGRNTKVPHGSPSYGSSAPSGHEADPAMLDIGLTLAQFRGLTVENKLLLLHVRKFGCI